MASVVRLDKVKASKTGNIESIQHTAALQNGMVCFLGDLVAGERELKQVVVPTYAKLETEALVFHASPEVTYKAGETLVDFLVSANQPGRAYHLSVGDIITLTDDAITGATVVDQYVAPKDTLNLVASSDGTVSDGTTTYTPRFAAKVIEKTTLNGVAATAIQVVRA